jgi:protein-tyrosine phosphatase
VHLLFVCFGNVCRSPVAERLALAWAEEALAASPELTQLTIGSAGLGAGEGRPMDPLSARALTVLGGDAEGFRSRPFSSHLAQDADLVLTMTRDQRRTVLTAAPLGLRRTFTLREAAALLPLVDQTGLGLLPLQKRAVELGLRLDAQRRHRESADDDDVPDPIGGRASVHAGTADMIAGALRPLSEVLFASIRQHPAVHVEPALEIEEPARD